VLVVRGAISEAIVVQSQTKSSQTGMVVGSYDGEGRVESVPRHALSPWYNHHSCSVWQVSRLRPIIRIDDSAGMSVKSAELPLEDQVHDALASLGDSIALAQTDFVQCFPQLAAIEALNERAQRARALLLEAIETLAPPRPTPFGSPESRTYDVLTLRYIERSSVVDISAELSLSRRQVHRDLKKAEAQLTELLRSWAIRGDEVALVEQRDPLSEELALFSSRPVQVQLVSVLQETLGLVAPLAESLGVSIERGEIEEGLPNIVADKTLVGQLLVQVLSLAVQAAKSKQVSLSACSSADSVELRVEFEVEDPIVIDSKLEATERIARAEGIHLRSEASGRNEVLILGFPAGSPVKVVVVEDNPGAVELYRRYLGSEGWQVEGISDPRISFDKVRSVQPQVVILDIMMPHIDGWRVLRTLKEHPETKTIPVIVCSVVDDPVLAEALGAAACLGKPVSRGELLMALSRCLADDGR